MLLLVFGIGIVLQDLEILNLGHIDHIDEYVLGSFSGVFPRVVWLTTTTTSV
jgi:hypothetical protein